jgi:hypothetical protein
MYLKLKWENTNVGPITVKIYRGDTAVDRANLTGLIATLSAGETEYSDTTVVAGNLYYYVFETTSATDRVVSQNIILRAVPRRGPGGTTLLNGDYNYGYYGSIPSSSFINTNELRAAVGFVGGTTFQVTPAWHKYARNGKILFIPEGQLATGCTFDMLYTAGLVYGADNNGPYTFTVPVNQKKQVKIGADWYWVRLMRGFNDDYGVFPTAAVVSEPLETFTCEWDDFTYPLMTWVPDRQRMVNVANITPTTMLTIGNWVQEKVAAAAGSQALFRGTSANTRVGLAYRTGSATNVAAGWWPVLELIETAGS